MRPNLSDKVNHVKQSRQFRPHHCHWPGCEKQVPPAMWGCVTHWFKLPLHLRSKIWEAYRPGQEQDARPSAEYIAVAKEVQEWIKSGQKKTI